MPAYQTSNTMKLQLLKNFFFITLVMLCSTYFDAFAQCKIGSTPECPFLYTVCPGETLDINVQDLDAPTPANSNITYTFMNGDNIACADCPVWEGSQHYETTLYTLIMSNEDGSIGQSVGLADIYVLVEVLECSNESNNLYDTDKYYELCQGETINLTNLPLAEFEDPNFPDCFDCTENIVQYSWKINGQEISTEKDIVIIADANTIISLEIVKITDCIYTTTNPDCIFFPVPQLGVSTVVQTFGIVVDKCETEETPSLNTNFKLFLIYPWLNEIISRESCTGTSVSIFKRGTNKLLFVEENGLGNLYSQNGDLWCTNTSIEFCTDEYQLNEPYFVWNCTDYVFDNINPVIYINSNPLFNQYPWLLDLVDIDNCDGSTIEIYKLNGVYYIKVINNEKSVLFNTDGSFYCEDMNSPNCILASDLKTPINVWNCNDDSNTYSEMFNSYPWLSSLYSSANCTGSFESITEYNNGANSFIYVQGADFGVLYNQNGEYYCADSEFFDCREAYSLESPTNRIKCGDQDRLPTELIPQFNVYPNPSSGTFSIQLNEQVENLHGVKIYSLQGKLMQETLIEDSSSDIQINAEHLGSGIYFVEIYYGFKTATKKLIIK